MPTYSYKFQDGTVSEVHHSIHDEPLEALVHPETGLRCTVIRVPTVPTIVLKGNGFARNDK